MRKIISFLLCFTFLIFTGPVHAETKLHILTTTSILKDALQSTVRDAEVSSLMGAGVDPHSYKPSQGDTLQLAKADIIITHGLHLEGKMQEILEKLSTRKPVYKVSQYAPENRLRVLGTGELTATDPHLWFDADLWKTCLTGLFADLSKKYPQLLDEPKVTQYLEMLARLDQETSVQSATLSTTQKVLVTAHDAFGYFAKRYGFEVKSVQGISTAADVGLADINALVDFIHEKKIKSVFIETSVPRQVVDSLIAGVHAKGSTVTLGGSLFSDALGTVETNTETFEKVFKHNVTTIISALK